MSATQNGQGDHFPPETVEEHRSTYQTMMDVTFGIGLPVGGAAVMLVALWLMDVNLVLAFILSFFTWLGLLGFAKTFFVH